MSDLDRELVDRAAQLADNHLFPSALEVDASGVVPSLQLDLVRDAGFHGLFTPV